MTPKANPAIPLAPLPGHSLLRVEGLDAAAFLHAQTMNDVRSLAPGQWHWNGWLNAKGRLIALFALLRTAPDAFVLVLPDFPAADLQAKLQRFVFRSKLRLQVCDELRCAAETGGAAQESESRDLADGDAASGWRLDMSGDGGVRFLHLLPADGAALGAHEPGVESAWRDSDLAHGLPRLDEEAVEAWTPQMLSLDRLRAFSLKKGCYPGQEIVARTHYLGKARRGLARYSGIGLNPGAIVEKGDGVDIGRVLCVTEDRSQGLAVVQLDHASEAMRTSAGPIALLPLFQGLQRPL